MDDESVLNSFKSNCEIYDSIKNWRSDAFVFLSDSSFRGSVVLLIDGLDELESVDFLLIVLFAYPLFLLFSTNFLISCLNKYNLILYIFCIFITCFISCFWQTSHVSTAITYSLS